VISPSALTRPPNSRPQRRRASENPEILEPTVGPCPLSQPRERCPQPTPPADEARPLRLLKPCCESLRLGPIFRPQVEIAVVSHHVIVIRVLLDMRCILNSGHSMAIEAFIRESTSWAAIGAAGIKTQARFRLEQVIQSIGFHVVLTGQVAVSSPLPIAQPISALCRMPSSHASSPPSIERAEIQDTGCLSFHSAGSAGLERPEAAYSTKRRSPEPCNRATVTS